MTEQAQVTSRRTRDFSIENWLSHLLSDQWCGNDTIPGSTKEMRFTDGSWPDIVNIHNDGCELWIGTMDEWHTHMNRTDARRMAWFILWEWWAKGEWFGLKRAAWYRLLHRRVARWQKDVPR